MSSLFSTILEISLAVGIIILLIVILSPWMDKKFTHKWKYYLWLVLAVRLLIPFQITIPQPTAEVDATHFSAVQITVPDAVTRPLETVLGSAAANEQEPTNGVAEPTAPVNAGIAADQATPVPADNPWYYQLSLLDIIQMIWLLGMLLFLLWHLGRYWAASVN